jgi:hypothetical protein
MTADNHNNSKRRHTSTTGSNNKSSNRNSSNGENGGNGEHGGNDNEMEEESSSKRIRTDEDTELMTASTTTLTTPTPERDLTVDEEQERPKRWRAHRLMEDYMASIGRLMMPTIQVNPFYHGLERVTALGYLTSPLRRTTIWEDWSPREVALFEAGLMQYGKDFSRIASKHLVHKQTKDVVAFYYVWKKTQHYQEWKRQYQPDDDAWILDTKETPDANWGKSK